MFAFCLSLSALSPRNQTCNSPRIHSLSYRIYILLTATYLLVACNIVALALPIAARQVKAIEYILFLSSSVQQPSSGESEGEHADLVDL